MTGNVIANGLSQLSDVVKGAATQAFLGQVSKPTLDQVEPRTGGGRKVRVKARMAAQPTPDTGMLVGGVVVDDQVQVQFAGRLRIDALQEAGEFLMPVLRHAIPDDRTIERAQSGEQSGGAVARVIVGHRAAAARSQRQTGLGGTRLGTAFRQSFTTLDRRWQCRRNYSDTLIYKLR